MCQDNCGIQTGPDSFFLPTQWQREKSGMATRDYICFTHTLARTHTRTFPFSFLSYSGPLPPPTWRVYPPGHGMLKTQLEALNFDQDNSVVLSYCLVLLMQKSVCLGDLLLACKANSRAPWPCLVSTIWLMPGLLLLATPHIYKLAIHTLQLRKSVCIISASYGIIFSKHRVL